MPDAFSLVSGMAAAAADRVEKWQLGTVAADNAAALEELYDATVALFEQFKRADIRMETLAVSQNWNDETYASYEKKRDKVGSILVRLCDYLEASREELEEFVVHCDVEKYGPALTMEAVLLLKAKVTSLLDTADQGYAESPEVMVEIAAGEEELASGGVRDDRGIIVK